MPAPQTAILLIDCPDRKGLVARVSGLLYEHGANILHADQHQGPLEILNARFRRHRFGVPQQKQPLHKASFMIAPDRNRCRPPNPA